jgi:MFS family permease
MGEARIRQRSRFEDAYVGASGALFSFAMGLSAVAIPLFALNSGLTAGQVGVLIAVSACAQLSVRTVMGSLMRRVADKHFVSAAGVLMALSCVSLLLSSSVWVFVVSQLAQGAARGVFWTGVQTHVVRTSTSAVAAIAQINLVSGIGQIVGPFLAGPIIEHYSLERALACATVVGVLVVLPSSLMVRLEPMRPKRKGRSPAVAVWRQPGVGLASWAGAVAGSWRAMMNSYVPVVLAQAGHGAAAIGVVSGIANATSIGGSAAAGWIKMGRLRAFLVWGIVTSGVGLALFGILAGDLVLATVALAVAGVGAGLLQTAGPAVASETVAPEERGEAIATAGTYRAAALLLAPLGVAGLVTVIATSAGIAVLGVAMAGPVLLLRGRKGLID